jgi:putative ABC transport system ATP-binding protein
MIMNAISVSKHAEPNPKPTYDSKSSSSGRGLRVSNLSIEYSRGAQKIRPIDSCSFQAERGSITLLLGPSGCGKTSILSCLGAMMQPAEGSIQMGNTEVVGLRGADLMRYRRNDVGIVFQAFNLIASLSSVENVSVVMTAAGVANRKAKAKSAELLEMLGLGERLHHRPDDLSGGQQQRVAIARAIALDPPLILADEPTAHLDHGSVNQVLDLYRRLAEEGRTVVVSTHDDRMLSIATQVVELGPTRTSGSLQTGVVQLRAGQTLFHQGDKGELIYVVNSGSVRVDRAEPDGSTIVLATRGPGQHVGEMAPLFGLPRSASVIAETATEVEALTPEAFRSRFGVTHLIGGH